MKPKDILLLLIGIAGAALIIYFSFIEPVIEGVSEYGLPGFALRLIEFFVVFIIVAGLAHYHDK